VKKKSSHYTLSISILKSTKWKCLKFALQWPKTTLGDGQVIGTSNGILKVPSSPPFTNIACIGVLHVGNRGGACSSTCSSHQVTLVVVLYQSNYNSWRSYVSNIKKKEKKSKIFSIHSLRSLMQIPTTKYLKKVVFLHHSSLH